MSEKKEEESKALENIRSRRAEKNQRSQTDIQATATSKKQPDSSIVLARKSNSGGFAATTSHRRPVPSEVKSSRRIEHDLDEFRQVLLRHNADVAARRAFSGPSGNDSNNSDDEDDEEMNHPGVIRVRVRKSNNAGDFISKDTIIHHLMAENISLKKQNRQLRKDIDKLKRDIGELQGSVKDSIDRQIRHYKDIIDQNEERHEERFKQLEKKYKTTSDALGDTNERALRLAEDNKELADEVASLRRENDELTRQVDIFRSEKEELQLELNQLKMNMQDNEQALLDLDQALKTTQQNLEVTERNAQETNNAFAKYRAQKEEEERKRQSDLLIGEVAFQLDRVVNALVMEDSLEDEDWENSLTRLSICDIREMAREDALTEEQLKRWKQFEKTFNDKGWKSVYHLTSTMRNVKGQNREEHAHLKTFKKQQTQQSLYKAAEEASKNSFDRTNYRKLIDLLCTIVGSNTPFQRQPS